VKVYYMHDMKAYVHAAFDDIFLKMGSREIHRKPSFAAAPKAYSFITITKKVYSKLNALLFVLSWALILLFITTSLLFPSIFAFGQNVSVGPNQTGNTQIKVGNNTNSTSSPVASTGSQPPVISKISDKGIYNVQLTFISTLPVQSPNLLPKKGFQMEIDFLNASAPPPTNKTIPQKESAIRGESSLGMPGSQPNIIQRLVPVDSFDISIYSNNGKVLWNKTNQPVTAGRGTETTSFNGNYTGPITILINNIKSSNVMTGTNTTPLSTPIPANTSSTAGKTTTVDSVRFTSQLL